jgi:hypothetical protein
MTASLRRRRLPPALGKGSRRRLTRLGIEGKALLPPPQRVPLAFVGQAAEMSFLHSELFLETVNLATDLPRFVQEHLSINPAALCRRELHLAKESS